MNLFERVAEAGGRLLRVDQAGGGRLGLLLTFDVGRVWVRPDVVAGDLVADPVTSAADLPDELEDACEEEPWWRLIGNELARASDAQGAGVRLQFRRDEENPRTVLLRAAGGAAPARIEAVLERLVH